MIRVLHKRELLVNHTGVTVAALAGKKHLAVFGSTDSESSDDSLVDLVSAERWSIAELPKCSFYDVQGNAVFGGESRVTFYERDLLPPRQLPSAKH